MRTDNNMIQKFTKRIEDLNKQKLSTQNQSNSQKKNKGQNDDDDNDERAHVFKKKTFKQRDAPEVKYFEKQKSADQNDQEKQPSQENEKESMKNNDGQKSRSSSKQLIEKQEGAALKKNLRSFSKRNIFDKGEIKSKKSQITNSEDDQPQEKDKQQKMRKLLEELNTMKISDQREDLIKKSAIQYKTEKSRFKTQLQGYKILFQIQDQIKSLPVQPSKKQLSRRFAKKMLKFVQMNIHEKKYKFINVCRVVFKGLKLSKFRTNVWVDKFIHQNKESLVGINLSQYISYDLPLMVGEVAKQKNKQKIVKLDQKEKDIKGTKGKFTQSKQKGKLQNIQYNQKKSVKQFHDIKLQKPKSTRKQLQKNKKIQKEQNKEHKIQQKKESNPQKKNQFSSDSQKVNQNSNFFKEFQNFEQSRKSSKNMSRDRNINCQVKKLDFEESLNSYYPQAFSKKIANKLDNIFKDEINRVFIQQSKQLCLEKHTIQEMYQKYGSLNLGKISQNKQFQEKKEKRKKQYGFEKQMRFNKDGVEEQDQIDPYSVLHSRLQYFVNNNIRCTEQEIKDEAIRIATTHPDVKGKVIQQHLALWIHQYLNSMSDKIYSNKVQFALQLINSEQEKLKINSQSSVYQIKNKSATHLNPILSREKIIQPTNGFKSKGNLSGSRILKQLETMSFGTK